jgi:hypothetical protein
MFGFWKIVRGCVCKGVSTHREFCSGVFLFTFLPSCVVPGVFFAYDEIILLACTPSPLLGSSLYSAFAKKFWSFIGGVVQRWVESTHQIKIYIWSLSIGMPNEVKENAKPGNADTQKISDPFHMRTGGTIRCNHSCVTPHSRWSSFG